MFTIEMELISYRDGRVQCLRACLDAIAASTLELFANFPEGADGLKQQDNFDGN